MRIDAHQHFWLLAKRDGAWPPPELAAIHRNFMPSHLIPLLHWHGIDGTVLVQSLPSTEDTMFMLKLAAGHPFIKAVVGWADLKAGDARETINTLASYSTLKGLRPMLQDIPEDDWIADPALAPAIEAMRENRLSLDALVLPRHLPSLLVFAKRFPDLPIVIDHAAKPCIAKGELQPWKDDIARLAALPQVHCKLSGMVTEAAPPWQAGDLLPYADHILEVFGAQRVMWGSDWPVLELAADYGRWIDTTELLLAGLGRQERKQVLGLNAQRFYRFD